MLNLKDMTNPFTRLVYTAGADDGGFTVPYYQLDQIKEATYQSEYGCDSVFKALTKLLEGGSASVTHKALTMVRVLMMEGPASFNSRAGALSGKMLQLAQQSDVRKGTVEERNRDLAQAIHQAIAGDARPLSTFAEQSAATSVQAPRSSYKSDFQAQQEKEQKMYKKRLDDEKRANALVVNERLFDTFDGSLPPQKLVDSAVQSHKKKFAKEELDSFVAAAAQTEKPTEVCALLEAFLRDGRQTLQNRYKVLTIVEAMLAIPEAIVYLKTHSAGITRHLTVDRADNPAKSQAAQQLAQNILSIIQNTAVQQPPVTRARASTVGSASAPPVAVQVPPSQPQPKTAAPAPQWEWTPAPATAGSMPTFGGGKPVMPSFDDMFANMSVRPAPQPQPQGGQRAPAGPASQQPQQWAAPVQQQPQQWAAPVQQQPQQWAAPVQQQPQQWAAPVQQQPQQWAAPVQQQQQQQVFNALTSPPLPAVPNNSLAVSPSLGHLSLPTSIMPQPAAADSQAQILQQMAELQRNMALMMQMVTHPPPSVPTPVVIAEQPSIPAPVNPPAPAASAVPAAVEEASLQSSEPAEPVVEVEAPPQPAAATSNPTTSDSNAENMALLLQLQQQMLATQQMLAQQQAAFQLLQAKLAR